MAKRKAVSPKESASFPETHDVPPPVIDSEEALARLCAEGAFDKKAENVVILDMREISSFTDFFVIVSGTSEPQLKAIASSIREKVRETLNERPLAEDGFPESQWVVIDYGSVIVHIFHGEKRPVYGLETLWGDAPRLLLHSVPAPS
jgi:ribosome-associated protein